MIPKLWPQRLLYSKESVSKEMHLALLRSYLYTGKPDTTSWVIENKCVHPDVEIRQITPNLKWKGKELHPLCDHKDTNYGIFAKNPIAAGVELGEYVGELYLRNKSYSAQDILTNTPSSKYSWLLHVNQAFLVVDAQHIANEMALVNDYRGLDTCSNVALQALLHKGVMYFGYVTIRDISQDEEVLANYGDTFWKGAQSEASLLKAIYSTTHFS